MGGESIRQPHLDIDLQVRKLLLERREVALNKFTHTP